MKAIKRQRIESPFGSRQRATIASMLPRSSVATSSPAVQRTRLTALFDAARAAPLYRHHLADRPAAEIALTEMPVIHKRTLMRHFADRVTDPELRLPALRAFTADPRQIAQPFLGRYQAWESSGTSGTPAVFVQDARAVAVYDALEALQRATAQRIVAQTGG